jgi:hypothetical protein
VWVHSSNRWLWLVQDLMTQPAATATADSTTFSVSSTAGANGTITLRATVRGAGTHRYALRGDNMQAVGAQGMAQRTVTLKPGEPATVEWTVRVAKSDAPWTAVIIEDGNVSRRRELFGQ